MFDQLFITLSMNLVQTVLKKEGQGKSFDIEERHNFNVSMEIPSCSWALFESKDQMFMLISSFQISKGEILDVVLKSTWQVRVLSLSMVLHCRLKLSLNRFAFINKLFTSGLFTRSGGIHGLFFPLTDDYKADQKVLGMC